MIRQIMILCFLCLAAVGGWAQPVFQDFEFLGLKLGQTQEEVTNLFSASQKLQIDETRFFGKINDAVPFIMKASYDPYIRSLYVQFYSNISYSITIQFEKGYFDYFTLSEKLQDKYGTPVKQTSRLMVWRNFMTNAPSGNPDEIELRLEYPCTVKLLDNYYLRQVNSVVSQKVDFATNQSTIASNKTLLLNEL